MSGRLQGAVVPRRDGAARHQRGNNKPSRLIREMDRRRISRSRSHERGIRRGSRELKNSYEPRRPITPLMKRTFRSSIGRETSPIVLDSRSVSRERKFEQQNLYSGDIYRENGRGQRGILEQASQRMQFSPPRRDEESRRFSGTHQNEARKLVFEPPVADYSTAQPEETSWRDADHKPLLQWEPSATNWERDAISELWMNQDLNVQSFISAEEGHADIPVFDNMDPEITARQWIRLIDTLGNKNDWSGDDRKFQFASKLAGGPKEWYLKEDKVLENWGKLKRSFPTAFRNDMDFYHSLTKMIARSKSDTETYSNYFTHKTLLLKQCSISGRKAVACLIGGLNLDKLKGIALDQNFGTPELLYTFLTSPDLIKKAELFVAEAKYCQGCKKSGHAVGSCPTGGKPAVVEPETQQSIMASSSRFINPRYFVEVVINGHSVQGYNDSQSQLVTMREDQTFPAKLIHNRQKRTIRGFGGASVTALGDANVLIRVGNAVVNMQVFIVPNMVQDVPVVIGSSLRKHPDVIFNEDLQGIHFNQKGYQPPQNSSFSMNEKLIQKMNDSRSTPAYKNDNSKIVKGVGSFKMAAAEKRPGKEYFNPFSYQSRNEPRSQFTKYQ